MNRLEKRLRESGLAGNEARVYLELLQRKEIAAYDLSKKMGMDRSLVYQVLNNLVDKGLVSFVLKNNKKYFTANKPENLLNSIKEKQAFVEDLITDLKQLEVKTEVSTDIRVYQGKQGLRNILKHILKSKYIYSFGATGKAYEQIYELPRLAKELTAKGERKIILSEKYKDHQVQQIEAIDFKYLDLESEATTTVTEDTVLIHYIQEKPIVVEIRNKIIAKSYKEHFKKLWEIAKKP